MSTIASDDAKRSNRAQHAFTRFMPFVCGCGGRSRGRSGSHFDLGREILHVVGGASSWVKSLSMMARKLAMGLRSLRMKRPLVVEPVDDGRGRTLVGLGECEVPARSNSDSTVEHAVRLGTDNLALAKDECCWLVSRPFSVCHARNIKTRKLVYEVTRTNAVCSPISLSSPSSLDPPKGARAESVLSLIRSALVHSSSR